MTGIKSFYDVIVVGGSLGAMVAGALLSRRGFRVAWIRHDHRPNAYAVDAETTFLRGPDALTFLDRPAFRRVASELALTPVLRRRISTPTPLYQVAMPGARIDVNADPALLLAEVAREFPEVRRPVEDFYTRLERTTAELDALFGADLSWPPDGFFARRAARAAAGRMVTFRRNDPQDVLVDLPADHPFRTFLAASTRFATAVDPDDVSPARILRAHGSAIRAATFLEGGRDALIRLLEEKIVHHGGELRTRDRVARLRITNGRVTGVDIGTTDEQLGCACVITSLHPALALRLGEVSPSRATTERWLACGPRYYRYTLNVLLRAEGVPTGMASRVYSVVDRARPLAEENLLAIEVRPPDPKGRALLTVSALLPRSGVDEGESYLRLKRERVMRALGELVPFLSRHVLAVDSPHDGRPFEPMTSGIDASALARVRTDAEPMTMLAGLKPDAFFGVCGTPTRSDLKGLLFAGPDVVPGLGDEGELLAGLSAARVVTRTDRTKERLRRELWSKIEG